MLAKQEYFGCPVRCQRNPPCMQGECEWLAEYYVRQRWINARYPEEKEFTYFHPEEVERFLRQGPCTGCKVERVCDMPCPDYVRWWNLRMEMARKGEF